MASGLAVGPMERQAEKASKPAKMIRLLPIARIRLHIRLEIRGVLSAPSLILLPMLSRGPSDLSLPETLVADLRSRLSLCRRKARVPRSNSGCAPAFLRSHDPNHSTTTFDTSDRCPEKEWSAPGMT